MNSLSFTRIFMNSPLVTRIQFRFIIFFAYSLWFHFPFREFIMNSLSVPRIPDDFIIFLAIGITILRNQCEFTIYFLIFEWIRIVPRNHCGSILFFINWLCFYYHLREGNMNILSVTRNLYEFAIYFANILLYFYSSHEYNLD